ncbi:MAG TPA: nuclease-related domain-containing protein [Gaiellaceae bacterium]|nr:nuclease-related domain-containing protein [Gaiellaceae bacterium]
MAFWDADAKTVTCLECLGGADGSSSNGEAAGDEVVLDRGVPGASARRRYERLHMRRDQRAREKFGRLGGVYLALTSDPQSTIAWAQGSRGERLLGDYLEKIQDDRVVVVLHDRRIPGTRANIDHIAVTRSGAVWAIDAKNYTGKVKRIDRGGWFSTDLRLYVGRRDCTKLVHGMAKQVEAIRGALGEAVIWEFNVNIRSALCFVGAEWSLFPKPFELGGVWIGWPRVLGDRLIQDGELAPEHLHHLASSVATALPSA